MAEVSSTSAARISPFGQVSRVLNIFSFCLGYPLAINSDGRVKFCIIRLIGNISPCLIKLIPIIFAVIYLNNNGHKIDEVKQIIDELGLSSLDAMTQFLLIGVTCISITVHIVCIVRTREEVNNFNSFMGIASKYFGERSRIIAQKYKRCGLKIVFATIICGFIFSVLIWNSWHELGKKVIEGKDPWVAAFVALAMTTQAFLGFFAPVVLAGEFLVIYLINYTAGHIQEWAIMLKSTQMVNSIIETAIKGTLGCDISLIQNYDNKKDRSSAYQAESVNNPKFDLEEHLTAGLKMCKSVEQLNAVVGDCVFNIFLTNTFSAILSTYGALTILFSMNVCSVSILFSATHMFLTVLFVVRLYILTFTGHRLIKALEHGRETLEDYIMYRLKHDGNSISENMMFTVEVLRARFDGSRSSISPLNFFTLSKVGFVSGLGTIITYIIVLIQFKASEK